MAIREKMYEEANKLLDENTIDLANRTFKQRIKWYLISTRNKFIWKYL